jgi:hypothetical protein
MRVPPPVREVPLPVRELLQIGTQLAAGAQARTGRGIF